jgi:hypothetical protein
MTTILGGKGEGGVGAPGRWVRTARVAVLNPAVSRDTAAHRGAWVNGGVL